MAEQLREPDPTLHSQFQAYQEILAPLNEHHPQRQGFLLEEFADAIRDPAVITTEHRLESGEEVRLPQMAPPEAFGWLHAPFYAERYPEEYARGDVMHFADLPGVKPGPEVEERIKQLADSGGILVFDYPDIDAEQPKRIIEYLQDLGVVSATDDTTEPPMPEDDKRQFVPALWRGWQTELELLGLPAGSIELLGKQTYHAGVVTLKRPHQARDPHLNYAQAFAEMVADGEVPEEQFVNGVSVQDVVEGEEADRLQEFYDGAYGTIADHPCEQGLTPEEFGKKLEDPGTSKTVFRRDGVAESLCLTTEQLEKLTWVNSDYYYTDDFRSRFGEGAPTWYPGIATDPDPSVAGHNFGEIMAWFTKLSEKGDNNSVVVFDTPDVNTEFMPGAVGMFVNMSPEASIDFTVIGDQKYCAIRLASAA